MKKLFLFTILIGSFYSTIGQSLDQNYKKVQISIGPTITYNTGEITLGEGGNRAIRGLNLDDFNAIGGGALVDFKFGNGLFLQAGLLYDTRMVLDDEFVSVDSSPFASSFKLKMSYINIPLVVGYTFGNRSTQPFISAGLQVGKGTKEEVSNVYKEELPSYIVKNEPVFEFDGIEYGILAEIGIRQKIGQSNLLNFGLQYMGGDRGAFVNRTNMAGGAVNIGTKKIALNLSFLLGL